MEDFVLLGVFVSVAALHTYLETHHDKLKHFHAHWLLILLHPMVLSGVKDWVIHIIVYSKYAFFAH